MTTEEAEQRIAILNEMAVDQAASVAMLARVIRETFVIADSRPRWKKLHLETIFLELAHFYSKHPTTHPGAKILLSTLGQLAPFKCEPPRPRPDLRVVR